MLYELGAFNLFEFHIYCFSQELTSECIPNKIRIFKNVSSEKTMQTNYVKSMNSLPTYDPRVRIGKENEKAQY